MAQETDMIDRDTHIAAALSGGWAQVDTAEMVVERFRQTLVALRKAGGAYTLWVQADPAKQSGQSSR